MTVIYEYFVQMFTAEGLFRIQYSGRSCVSSVQSHDVAVL